jgi:Na+/phosphate symporter
MEHKIKELTLFQVKRKITNIYKNFFFILEDLSDHGCNINEETYAKIRKRVLDNSNDAIREIEEFFNTININLK